MKTSNIQTVKTDLPQEPIRYTKRLGSVVYEVEVRFNPNAKETMNDKKLRLIRRDMEVAS